MDKAKWAVIEGDPTSGMEHECAWFLLRSHAEAFLDAMKELDELAVYWLREVL